MVVNSLDGRASEEPHSLTSRHERELVRNTSTEGVEEKAFKRMIVQGTECVGDI